MMKKLYRSNSCRIIAGVCGGVAEYFDIDPSIVRIVVVLLSIGSIGTGALIYLIAALVIPKEM